MVSTSARRAGDPWFDSRSGHDRFCASVSICLYIYILSSRNTLCFKREQMIFIIYISECSKYLKFS